MSIRSVKLQFTDSLLNFIGLAGKHVDYQGFTAKFATGGGFWNILKYRGVGGGGGGGG